MESWQMLTEWSSGRIESWGNLTEGLQPLIMLHEKLTEVDGKSSCHTETRWKLTEGLPAAWRVDGIWRKVFQTHGNLTEVDERFLACTESRRKLTEGLSATRKIDRSLRKVSQPHERQSEHVNAWKVYGSRWNVFWRMESWRKLTEGHLVTRIIDESWQNVSRPYRKLTEADRRTQIAWKVKWSWQKVQQSDRTLSKGPTDTRKVDRS